AQISQPGKTAFLAATAIKPSTLTLPYIMTHKYTAQCTTRHNELRKGMRRYPYTDMDPVSGKQVIRSFSIRTNLETHRHGKPVQRLRPRYNSEYVWNRAGLDKIGGLAPDYHTKPLWITEP